jgi:hypothetical protein
VVKVLVGNREGGRFTGYWAEFEGQKVSSYEVKATSNDARAVVYALYKCTAYEFEAYRVHVTDETNHQAPTYKLYPWTPEERFEEPYSREQIALRYPLFLKDINYFETHPIDPPPKPWRR